MNPPPFSRDPLKYLAGYPQHLQAQVQVLIEQGRLGTILADKYGQTHTVRPGEPNQLIAGPDLERAFVDVAYLKALHQL